MGFSDYPFFAKSDPDRDRRRFPGHREVLMYLQDFTSEFGIGELVRFETEIMCVRLVDDLKWKIKSKGKDETTTTTTGHVDEIFDAVVVCNGHNTQPRIAEILRNIKLSVISNA
jgi:cation diffusion facilitator CzcD-associated flavoprotein CzcO